jgi:cyclopropane fatty-acyl-phospholipid synthase-like methyltransferase
MTTWLHDQRIEAVLAVLRARGATTVLDLGCGAGPVYYSALGFLGALLTAGTDFR